MHEKRTGTLALQALLTPGWSEFQMIDRTWLPKKTLKSNRNCSNPNCNLCTADEEITEDHPNTCSALQEIRTDNTGADRYVYRTNLHLAARIRMAEPEWHYKTFDIDLIIKHNFFICKSYNRSSIIRMWLILKTEDKLFQGTVAIKWINYTLKVVTI